MARVSRILVALGVLSLGTAACGPTSSSSSFPFSSVGTTSTVGGFTGSTLNPSPSSTMSSSPALFEALGKLYSAEADARATYNNIVLAYGEVDPFATIANAEQKHMATLAQVATNHGITLPAETFTGSAAPSGYTTACQLGSTTEQTIIALYNQYIPQVTSYKDATTAFQSLLEASQNHLTAFQRC